MSTVQENWESQEPLPDMRLLIQEPSVLKNESLRRLEDVGWGLCHVPKLTLLPKVSQTGVCQGPTVLDNCLKTT